MRKRLCLLLLSTAAPAFAHMGEAAHAHASGFWAGAIHPWIGVDHLTAMLAIGVWSALALRRPLRAPLAFAAALLAGALLARLAGWTPPAVEAGIAVSLLALGLLIARRIGLPTAAGTAVAALLALGHGSAHGLELAGAAALAGMVLGTLVLHGLGLALGWKLRAAPKLAHALLGTAVAAVALAPVLR